MASINDARQRNNRQANEDRRGNVNKEHSSDEGGEVFDHTLDVLSFLWLFLTCSTSLPHPPPVLLSSFPKSICTQYLRTFPSFLINIYKHIKHKFFYLPFLNF